jgi:hypothetical protein
MRRALWGLVAVVVTAVGGLAAYTARETGDCAVERLALPSPGAYSLVFAMDPSGRHIVGRTRGGGDPSDLDLVVWTDGRPRRVDLPGDSYQIPEDVNAAGIAVGTTTFGTLGGPMEHRAWQYRDGAATTLPLTEAFGVSDDGVVDGTHERRPALWSPGAAAPTPLATSTGDAYDITPDGRTIVGMTGTGSSLRPYVWSADGTPRELPLPTIDGRPALGAGASSVTGDWVTGFATTWQSDRGLPVRWNLRTGEVTAFPRYDLGGAAVSDGGVLSAKEDRHAVLLGGPRTLTLRRLDDGTAAPDTAEAISPDGRRIAGNAASAGAGGTAPVLWRCAA